ncbi:hypothetical protein [Bradyrhizobium prioriisuperbiae]|uniref:hypothetical protein n=1 Tax=Bradyrhizobium prioriisuperbiae TaxID=2854389 RepID=UPI0028E4379F|nr:hypothetical protein [Bradyrhizobium prioritasuperba]
MNVERQLRERISELEEALRQANETVRPSTLMPAEWRLPRSLARLAVAFSRAPGGFLTQAQVVDIVCLPSTISDNPSGYAGVRICHLRKAVSKYEIEILTRWGEGYEMPAASRDVAL